MPGTSFRLASFHHGAYDEKELGNLGLRVNGRTLTSAQCGRNTAPDLHYEAALGQRYDSHGLTGGLRVSW